LQTVETAGFDGGEGFVMSLGATAAFRAWTPEEKTLVRERYVIVGPVALAAELGRTQVAVQNQAKRLGTLRRRRWTAADDDDLRDLWGTLSLDKIAKRIGRTVATTYWRADKLGLGRGATQGHEYLTDAAKRTGFDTVTLRRVLKWHGVKLLVTMSRPTGARRHYHAVDPFDVDEAVKAWLECEDIATAARSRGLPGETLAWWIEKAQAHGALKAPERPGGKCRWRVPSSEIDAALEWRAAHESIAKAAKRVGMKAWKLRALLIAAGTAKWCGKPWFVLKSEVDRVVALSIGADK
jgi:hypothetical protein